MAANFNGKTYSSGCHKKVDRSGTICPMCVGRITNSDVPADYDIPMSITRLRSLMQFMGSHDLPVERGRPALARHMRFCTCCNTQAVGDERHHVFDCPAFHIQTDYDTLCWSLLAPCNCSCGIGTRRLFLAACP